MGAFTVTEMGGGGGQGAGGGTHLSARLREGLEKTEANSFTLLGGPALLQPASVLSAMSVRGSLLGAGQKLLHLTLSTTPPGHAQPCPTGVPSHTLAILSSSANSRLS